MADDQSVKGVLLNWNVITMIVSVVVITVSLLAWFDSKFASFESSLQEKYATHEDLQDATVLIYSRTISGLEDALDTMIDLELIPEENREERLKRIKQSVLVLRDTRERLLLESSK